MKKVAAALVLLAMIGCKGKDGAAGAPGASFTSSMVTLNGAVSSNSIPVTVPGLNLSRGDILAVYTCIGTSCVQLNLWQAGISNNMFYIAQGNVVTIDGALAGSQTLWYISALERI